jgi:hypothetical protein
MTAKTRLLKKPAVGSVHGVMSRHVPAVLLPVPPEVPYEAVHAERIG